MGLGYNRCSRLPAGEFSGLWLDKGQRGKALAFVASYCCYFCLAGLPDFNLGLLRNRSISSIVNNQMPPIWSAGLAVPAIINCLSRLDEKPIMLAACGVVYNFCLSCIA